MKLRTRLFFNLLILLCGYAIVIFFVPTFIVVRDIGKVGDEIHSLIIRKQRRLVRDQEVLVEEIFQGLRSSLNATLLFVSESIDLRKEIQQFKEKKYATVWEAAAHLASHHPTLGFLQISDRSSKEAIVLKPAEATIFRAMSSPIKDDMVAVQLDTKSLEQTLYLGMVLPKEFQKNRDFTYYAIIDWNKAAKQLKEITDELKEVEASLKSLPKELDEGQIFTAPDNKETAALDWLYKMEMIRLLTPLVVEGIKIGDTARWVPEGLARVSAGGVAEVIFSDQLLGTIPEVDAAKYYSAHPPSKTAPPLAEGNFFIYNHDLQHVYIANAVNLDGTFLTVGIPIDKMAKEFAVWADKPVLISVGDKFWMGFDGGGNRYTHKQLHTFSKEGIIQKESGVFKYGDRSFFFSNIAEFEGGRVGMYELAQLDGKDSIASLSLSVAHNLAWKISLQIFIISILVIALILFIISRAALYFSVRPIVKLASITELIVSGQYDNIDWPNMGKRKDEIATLTHAFEQMVIGLREKEKIRGVLDKVVSKDVANEILKSQIHLGGEERRVSVLFSDIRGFTQLTDRLTPCQTIELLNSCMTKITQVIEGEGGVIDKFVGDAVMAIYGAPTRCEDHALRSVSSGILIIRAMKIWNDERETRGEVRIDMGIGINTGEVVAGNMGAIDRLNYTVLGKNVNVASRLCSIAKGKQLIISEQTLNEPGVKESFYVEALPSVMLKGFSEPFRIFHVVDFKWDQSEES